MFYLPTNETVSSVEKEMCDHGHQQEPFSLEDDDEDMFVTFAPTFEEFFNEFYDAQISKLEEVHELTKSTTSLSRPKHVISTPLPVVIHDEYTRKSPSLCEAQEKSIEDLRKFVGIRKVKKRASSKWYN